MWSCFVYILIKSAKVYNKQSSAGLEQNRKCCYKGTKDNEDLPLKHPCTTTWPIYEQIEKDWKVCRLSLLKICIVFFITLEGKLAIAENPANSTKKQDGSTRSCFHMRRKS